MNSTKEIDLQKFKFKEEFIMKKIIARAFTVLTALTLLMGTTKTLAADQQMLDGKIKNSDICATGDENVREMCKQ